MLGCSCVVELVAVVSVVRFCGVLVGYVWRFGGVVAGVLGKCGACGVCSRLLEMADFSGRTAVRPYTPRLPRGRGAGGEGKKRTRHARSEPKQCTLIRGSGLKGVGFLPSALASREAK